MFFKLIVAENMKALSISSILETLKTFKSAKFNPLLEKTLLRFRNSINLIIRKGKNVEFSDFILKLVTD